VNAENSDGDAPLQCARRNGFTELATMLLGKGAVE